MVGLFAAHASEFLRVIAVLTVLVFAVPISLAPLKWARALRWSIDAQPHLALYFGRCLGVVALALSGAAWYAASHVAVQAFYFGILIAVAGLLTLVHIVGALQKVQPWTETAEIPFWGGLAALGIMFHPVV